MVVQWVVLLGRLMWLAVAQLQVQVVQAVNQEYPKKEIQF
jgi:hypothetical protein